MVFFECRVEQLTQDLAQAEAEVARLQRDLALSSEREVALKKELAASEARANQAIRERNEAMERVAAWRIERERFLDKLIQAERIRQAGEEDEGLDLASFIAELRSEVLTLRAALNAPREAGSARPDGVTAPEVEVTVPPPPVPYRSTEDAARALASAGRLGLTSSDVEALKASAKFETRSEETLFALSLRELTSSDARSRLRAAQRLKTLGARAATPAVAASLKAETDAEVAAALIEVLAASGDASVLPMVRPHLSAPSDDVRNAALEACFRLGDSNVLLNAMDDASPRVRRRAAVLAAGAARDQAQEVLARAADDADSSVRRVAALGLSSLGGPTANDALLAALDDDDATVRRAAAKGLSRVHGPEVFAIADLEPARRKREIRKLSTQPARPLAPARQQARVAQQPVIEEPAPAPVEAPVAIREESEDASLEALKNEIASRVFAALRGQSLEDLGRGTGATPEQVMEATSALEQSGRLVRRGQRYYVP